VPGKNFYEPNEAQNVARIHQAFAASQRCNQMIAPLSAREVDIVKLVAEGKTYREIAQILGLSAKTVDCYSQRIKLKTQCHSVALLVRFAIKNGWAEL
jgi:DNA-binding NarL/FixJ family response regulator